MPSQKSSPVSSANTISSRSVDVWLPEHHVITRQLERRSESPDQTYVLFAQASEADYQVSHLSGFIQVENPNEIKLEARIDLPGGLNDNPQWQATMRDRLKARLEEDKFNIEQLDPSDSDSLFALIDAKRIFEIGFKARLNSRRINVQTLALDALKSVTQQDYPQARETFGPVRILRDFMKTYATILDEVGSTNQDQATVESRSIIDLRPRFRSNAITDDPSTTQTSPEAEQQIPELEQLAEDKVTFDSLGGLHAAKKILEQNVIAIEDPENAAHYGITSSHFILHGPAGTGKTSLAEALANQLNAEFIEVTSDKIMSKWVGEPGRAIAKIFEEAYETEGPVVIFFDEADWIGTEVDGENKSHTEVRNLFKQYIIKTSQIRPDIIIGAATNKEPSSFDEAIVRPGRLRSIGVPLPNKDERVEIWGACLSQTIASLPYSVEDVLDQSPEYPQKLALYSSDIDFRELARLSDGMTGAHFKAIMQDAQYAAYQKFKSTSVHQQITHADLVQCINAFNRR